MSYRLTEQFVKGLQWNGAPEIYRDDRLPGFFVAVGKTRSSYKIQADLWRGKVGHKKLLRTIRHTIGVVGDLPLVEARLIAADLITQIKKGIDPFPSRSACSEPLSSGSNMAYWTVKELVQAYIDDVKARDSSPRTIESYEKLLKRYFKTIQDLLAVELKKSDTREFHRMITDGHGKTAANQCLRLLRAAFNFAFRICDDNDIFLVNPVKAVTFNKERGKGRSLRAEELRSWWQEVQSLDNPIRRELHILSLLSGLRSISAKSIEKEWINLEQHAIQFPEMKSRRAFDLPLSDQMESCVRRALEASDLLFPNSKWLFPTRSKQGDVIATAVVREKLLPSQTGHILRHTHRTMAHRAGVNEINARLLLDHKVPGISGVYLDVPAIFEPLRKEQQRVSDYILSYCISKAGS